MKSLSVTIQTSLAVLCTFRSFEKIFFDFTKLLLATHEKYYHYKDKLLIVYLKEAPPLNAKTVIGFITKFSHRIR